MPGCAPCAAILQIRVAAKAALCRTLPVCRAASHALTITGAHLTFCTLIFSLARASLREWPAGSSKRVGACGRARIGIFLARFGTSCHALLPLAADRCLHRSSHIHGDVSYPVTCVDIADAVPKGLHADRGAFTIREHAWLWENVGCVRISRVFGASDDTCSFPDAGHAFVRGFLCTAESVKVVRSRVFRRITHSAG